MIRFSDGRKEKIIVDYAKHKNMSKVAKMNRVCATTVKSILLEAGKEILKNNRWFGNKLSKIEGGVMLPSFFYFKVLR